jgi:hypothetical protein
VAGGTTTISPATTPTPATAHTSPGGNGQDTSVVYGKILRIDPVNPALTPGSTDPASMNGAYRVPASNPFAGATAGLDEIFAYGLRNPFRFSFDRGGTHQLYAGDVGTGDCAKKSTSLPAAEITAGSTWRGRAVNTTAIASIRPIDEYTHTSGTVAIGTAVIGGFVYRGNSFPEMSGKYIFGDLDPGSGHGRLFYSDATQPGPTSWNTITEFTFATGNAAPGRLYSFGEDKDGEIYAMFDNGTVARLLGRQWMSQTSGSWNTTGNWLLASGGVVPNGANAVANFLGRATSNITVTLDGSKTLAELRFNNPTNSYTIAPGTGGTLTLGTGSSVPIAVIRGSHHVNVPVTLFNSANLDVSTGASIDFTSPVTLVAPVSLFKLGGGVATLSGGVVVPNGSTLHADAGILNANNIQGSNSSVRADGGILAIIDGPTSKFSNLTVTAGQLDVTHNGVVIDGTAIGSWGGSSYTGLLGYVASGRNGGAWNGTGIGTSEPAAATGLTAVAIATAGETGKSMFKGVSVGGSNVLVMYTYAGDANLDGKINVDDYGRIDLNVPLGTHGWYNGDFNYDGKINVDDYGIIDFNIGIQGAPFSASASPSLALVAENPSAIPEPVLLSLIAFPAIALRRRRSAARIRPRWTST